MIERHVGDDRHAGLEHVRAVEPPADPRSEHPDVDRHLREGDERHGEQRFVIGRPFVFQSDPFDRRHHFGEQIAKRVFGDRDAVNPDAFGDRDQVGLRVQADDPVRGAQDRGDHRRGRTLPARAGHVVGRILQLGMTQLGDERANALEPMGNRREMLVDQAEQVGLRGRKVHDTTVGCTGLAFGLGGLPVPDRATQQIERVRQRR